MIKVSLRKNTLAFRNNGYVLRSSLCRTYASLSPLGVDQTVENNLQTETNRLAKTFTKFWDNVTLNSDNDALTVALDNKPIRTSLGHTLTVPKSRELLAIMLKNEWSSLPNLSIKPHSLPLTSIVSRCIDLESVSKPGCDPDLVSKIGGDRVKLSEALLRYLDTDTLLCFSPHAEYEGTLRSAQNEMYLPIISAIERFLSKFSSGPLRLQVLDADLHGLRGNAQSEEVREAARKYLNTLNLWDFTVFEKTVFTTKSFICAILLLESKAKCSSLNMKLSMEEIAKCATLETIYQTDRWGEVEDTHDVDKRDVRRNINAAAIVAYEE